MKISSKLGLFVSVLGVVSGFAIVPNQNISRGKTFFLQKNGTIESTDYLTDGSLLNWKAVSAKDMALKVGEGPSKLFITWESLGDCAWATDFTSGCGHSGNAFNDFKILTSANSTTGFDGTWDTAAVVNDNVVMSRGIEIDFKGKSWFRLVGEKEADRLLEIEAFDMSRGGTDTWFFMGTSISQMGIKQQDTDSTTADLIHTRFEEFTPAMLRGGIGCINSSEVVAHLDEYLKYAGNVHYWAIEMGTNDAWGGGDWNLGNFVDNMQTIIDAAKAQGITPIIARIIATDSAKAGWQINPAYLNAIDSLIEVNHLPIGPDFYSYFYEHPELLASDGVHPNAETGGGKAMHRLWADALAKLYEAKDPAEEIPDFVATNKVAKTNVFVQGNRLQIVGALLGSSVELFDMQGRLLQKKQVLNPVEEIMLPHQGLFVVRAGNASQILRY